MAATPAFLQTAMHGRADLSVTNTARDGTGTLVAPNWMGSGVAGATTAFTAGAPITDWALNRIVIGQTADLADCVITLFTTDGTTIKFLTDIDVGNPTAASATVTGLVNETVLVDYLFPANCNLLFGITAAPTSGNCTVSLFGQRV